MAVNEPTAVQTPTPEPSKSIEFTTFMRAYQDMVFSTAARLTGNDAHAEDIAQDVFIKAYEQFGHLRQSPTAGGWLKTVATHLTLNYLKRYRNRRQLFSELAPTSEEQFSCPDSVLADLTTDQRSELIEDALRRLPDQQRVPLVLFHFEELSYQEIATQLQISLAKVKSDIHRGREALLPLLPVESFI
jgi:RNA polymerase sigma-70 factor (ECF subfamily)